MPYVSKGEFFFYFDQTYFIIIHLITESDVLLEYHWGLQGQYGYSKVWDFPLMS